MRRLKAQFPRLMPFLIVGIVLCVALATAVRAQDSTASAGQRYTVQPGDNLDLIGQRFNVSVVSIQIANRLSLGAILRAGDVLIIPAGAPPYGFFPPITGVGAGGAGGGTGRIYVVQERDILDLIAAYFDVDLACLARANELGNPALIQPGLALLIPGDCPPYRGLSSIIPRALRGLLIGDVAIDDLPVMVTPLPPPATATPPLSPTSTELPSPTPPLPTPTQEVLGPAPTNTPILPAITRGPTVTPTPSG